MQGERKLYMKMKSFSRYYLFSCIGVLILCLCCSCSVRDEADLSLYDRICTADEALKLAKEGDVVVICDMECVSGQEVWDEFYERVSDGKAASVLCAHYYTLNEVNIDHSLYEEIKDDYPMLYFMKLVYDGESFTIEVRLSSSEEIDYSGTYKYLNHYTGEMPPQATYDNYEYYVLVDSESVTWENIWDGIFSSQFDAGVRHYSVYQNLT